MNLQRVKATILYAWYHLTHSLETWVDLVWFPLVEIVVFGLFSQFFDSADGNITQVVLMGLIFWEIVRLVQYSITVGIMWDVWSSSFSTLFVSPLSIGEFITGQAIAGIGKSIFVFILLSLLSLAAFGFTPLQLSLLGLVAYWFLLSLFSISAGIFVFALILRFGTDIQALSWSLIYLYQPISAVIYPVSALPEGIRWLASISPITPVMESARHELATGAIRWDWLLTSLLINMLYFAGAVLLYRITLSWSKRTGAFARMEM